MTDRQTDRTNDARAAQPARPVRHSPFRELGTNLQHTDIREYVLSYAVCVYVPQGSGRKHVLRRSRPSINTDLPPYVPTKDGVNRSSFV